MARLIGPQEIEDIALDAAVLGTVGGGDPYIGKLMAVQSIRECGPVQMVSAHEIDDDAQVAMAAMMGAPTVMVEKLPSGKEVVDADGMGRAFPELQMVTPTMYGISATPMAAVAWWCSSRTKTWLPSGMAPSSPRCRT